MFLSAYVMASCFSTMALAAECRVEGEEEVTLAPKEDMESSNNGGSWERTEKNLIVTLDPGHGGYDSGATERYNGRSVLEKNLNLKIALACKKELEKYDGITVYMTRSDDRYVGLADRVIYAESVRSDLIVSMHNNSSDSSGPRGAMVLIPNGNYRPNLLTESKKTAGNVLANLKALGLKNDGYLQRNSSENKYPDGSRADYYSILRNATLRNIPSMIIEHAFLSSRQDYSSFLSSDAKLNKLGVADANAIVKAYHLQKKGLSAAEKKDAPFTDVYSGKYYYNAVIWAYKNKITSGTDRTKFSPNAYCTRAQEVTYLWNAAKRPAPQNTDITAVDVADDIWYHNAVYWAMENHITAGTKTIDAADSAPRIVFSPDAVCTRAQVAQFLWNASGKPMPKKTEATFTDVNAEDWYFDAVNWAAERKITAGTGDNKFSPYAPCTRAQIVQLLYSYYTNGKG